MQRQARRQACFSYPTKPKLVLLEQPWQLARSDWSAEDPGNAGKMLGELLSYAEAMGIPVFSSHSSKHEFPEARRFAGECIIRQADIQSVTSRGYQLNGLSEPGSFIGTLIGNDDRPVIVGGAHAQFAGRTALGRFLANVGIQDLSLDGLCILGPLRFLFALKDAGLLHSQVFLDPRLTIQLSGSKMDESRLYEVTGADADGSSFSIRASMRL